MNFNLLKEQSVVRGKKRHRSVKHGFKISVFKELKKMQLGL